MKKALFLLIIIPIIFSCMTDRKAYLNSELNKAILTGKVISEEGLPLEGVTVKLAGARETQTDINGKFLFNMVKPGKNTVIFKKEGYTTEEITFEYKLKNRKAPMVKAKLFSMNYLIKQGFEYLKERNFKEVQPIIEKLESINPDAEVFLYLKAMFNFSMGEYEKARIILENLRRVDIENEFYTLTLIEIYGRQGFYDRQVKLCIYIAKANPEKYLEYLKKAAEIYKVKMNNPRGHKTAMDDYYSLMKKLNLEEDN